MADFVKTRLALDRLEEGQILEVIIDDGDPIRNVSRSIKDEGQQVDNLGGAFRLIVRKVQTEGGPGE